MINLILFIFILAFPKFSIAGTAGAPRIVWVNLESDKSANTVVKNFIDSQPEDRYCDGSGYGLQFYMRDRPRGITDLLVQKSFLEKDEAARRSLVSSLNSFKDKKENINDGLDGIIALAKINGYHLFSLDAKNKIQSSDQFELNEPDKIVKALCDVTPLIYRDHG